MKEEMILLSCDGPDRNVLKLKPPMVFTAANADHVVKVLDELLEELSDNERSVVTKSVSTEQRNIINNNNDEIESKKSKMEEDDNDVSSYVFILHLSLSY